MVRARAKGLFLDALDWRGIVLDIFSRDVLRAWDGWLNEVAPSRQAEEGKQPDATPANDLEVPQQSDDLSNVQSLRPRRLREHARRNEEPDPQDNIFAQYFYKKQKR